MAPRSAAAGGAEHAAPAGKALTPSQQKDLAFQPPRLPLINVSNKQDWNEDWQRD